MLKVSFEEQTYVIRNRETFELMAKVSYGEYQGEAVVCDRLLLTQCLAVYRQLAEGSEAHNEVLEIIGALEMREVHHTLASIELEVGLQKPPSIKYILCNRHKNSRVEVLLGVDEQFIDVVLGHPTTTVFVPRL